ncbi:MAG: DUF192 domain-containing protein [Oligoflexia bacterium]|nr:DUF192 domain-containing protein [Oligoflexia bacterium]
MFKKEMKTFLDKEPFDGLLIESCTSIHTCFMQFNIDVLFLDKNNTIIKIIKNMSPWRISWFYFRARRVLELKSEVVVDNHNHNHNHNHNLDNSNHGDKVEFICLN